MGDIMCNNNLLDNLLSYWIIVFVFQIIFMAMSYLQRGSIKYYFEFIFGNNEDYSQWLRNINRLYIWSGISVFIIWLILTVQK